MFIGSNYDYWKTRMTTYIKAQDYHILKVIVNGPHVPTKTMEEQEILKLENEWDENDVKLIELNYKTINFYIMLLTQMNLIESRVVTQLKKFGINLKLHIKDQVKLKNQR